MCVISPIIALCYPRMRHAEHVANSRAHTQSTKKVRAWTGFKPEIYPLFIWCSKNKNSSSSSIATEMRIKMKFRSTSIVIIITPCGHGHQMREKNTENEHSFGIVFFIHSIFMTMQ